LSDALFSELSLALSRAGGIGLADAMANPLLRQTAPDGGAGAMPPGVGSLPGVAGPVTSGYGWRTDPIDGGRRFHRGIDIALPAGHDVPAAQAGRVTFAGERPGYGLMVVVEHAGGQSTRYAHLSALEVRAGDRVDAGQIIARSGATGRATGPHLHVELIAAGKTVNPADALRTYVQGGVTGR
jgi:murein DD-endopeptidase MepM/ murein hydrolase activator NlpD